MTSKFEPTSEQKVPLKSVLQQKILPKTASQHTPNEADKITATDQGVLASILARLVDNANFISGKQVNLDGLLQPSAGVNFDTAQLLPQQLLLRGHLVGSHADETEFEVRITDHSTADIHFDSSEKNMLLHHGAFNLANPALNEAVGLMVRDQQTSTKPVYEFVKFLGAGDGGGSAGTVQDKPKDSVRLLTVNIVDKTGISAEDFPQAAKGALCAKIRAELTKGKPSDVELNINFISGSSFDETYPDGFSSYPHNIYKSSAGYDSSQIYVFLVPDKISLDQVSSLVADVHLPVYERDGYKKENSGGYYMGCIDWNKMTHMQCSDVRSGLLVYVGETAIKFGAFANEVNEENTEKEGKKKEKTAAEKAAEIAAKQQAHEIMGMVIASVVLHEMGHDVGFVHTENEQWKKVMPGAIESGYPKIMDSQPVYDITDLAQLHNQLLHTTFESDQYAVAWEEVGLRLKVVSLQK